MGIYTNIRVLKVLGSLLSPKHESSLKCFLKAILNIWGHCKYRQSSLPSLWWAFTTAAHPSQSGGKSATTLWLNYSPPSHFTSLCITVPSWSGIYSGICGRHLISLYPSPVCDSLPVYQLSLAFLDRLLLTSPGGLLCGIQNSECRKEA